MADEYPSIARYRLATENFLKHIEETKDKSRRTGKPCYLYNRQGDFLTSFIDYSSRQWLYRVLPSGRREFSNDGAILARSLGIIE